MVALEFFGQLNTLHFVDSKTLDDFADRCCCILSFSVVFICFAIVTVKSYVLDPFSCYTATTYSGSSIGNYINAFCWVTGTIPGSIDKSQMDQNGYWERMEEKKLNYYQWVSFVLALQAILCYLPKLVWDTIVFNRVGTDLKFLVETAQKASNESGPSRAKNIGFVTNTINTLLFARRELKHPAKSQSFGAKLLHMVAELFPRKRLGNALTMYYFMIKCLYLLTSFGQIFLMEAFLGLDNQDHLFGLNILHSLIQGKHWEETKVFPRVGLCRVPVKTQNAPISHLTAQCSLPINMLNEKIYVFLWFWFVAIGFIESISMLQWLVNVCVRKNRIKRIVESLRILDSYDNNTIAEVAEFERTFLKADGAFLLQMIRLNAGDIVSNEILKCMIEKFIQEKKYEEDSCKKEPPTAIDTPKSEMLPPAYPDETDTLLKRRENFV